MVSREVEIVNATGLHTRPGKDFVREAKKFPCDVKLKRGEEEVSGKSLLKLMKLGVSQGDMITIICEGEQEQDALENLCSFIANLTE